jgi:anti-sigma B factor antagonist
MQNVLVKSRVSVLKPSGHLNAANVKRLQKELIVAVSSQQSPALLVDMSLVESLDSSGLMVFVSALTLAQKLDQRFGLCNVSPPVRIIFELTQLDRVFEIFESHSAFEAVVA